MITATFCLPINNSSLVNSLKKLVLVYILFTLHMPNILIYLFIFFQELWTKTISTKSNLRTNAPSNCEYTLRLINLLPQTITMPKLVIHTSTNLVTFYFHCTLTILNVSQTNKQRGGKSCLDIVSSLTETSWIKTAGANCQNDNKLPKNCENKELQSLTEQQRLNWYDQFS